MLQQLSLALQITLIGMGLVFFAIILLWGTMALMMRLFSPRDTAEADFQELSLKQRAAVAAVSATLSLEKEDEPHEFPLPPTAVVSPWQGVMRSNMLRKRGPTR